MGEKYGLILIDSQEIIINIYELNSQSDWKLLGYKNHDLATFNFKKPIRSAEIIEIIAENFLSKNTYKVTDWKICARNVSEIILKDVSSATSIHTELLTLQREQELLCKGMLLEI